MADKPKSFPVIQPAVPPSQTAPRILPRQITTGVMSGQQLLDTDKVQINSSDGNIIISDGTNDRILIGFQKNGF